MARFVPGAKVGDRFEIVGPLGRGGMATVWMAQDLLRHERVALKVLHEHLATEPGMRARLRREVQAAGRLRHPNALVAHELHEIDGQLVLAMPVHVGASLADHVAEQGPLSATALQRLFDDIGGALAAAHAEGVLHRDVTPNNVLVGADGRFVLVDFGLARLEGQGTATGHTGALGTAGYAAPEVYRGVRTDPRSDLYGLGATVWFAATGKAPFDAPNPMGVLEKQLAGDLPPLARDDLPAAFAAVLAGLLAVEPDERPDGAEGAVDAARGQGQAPLGRRLGLPTGSFTVVIEAPREVRDKRPRDHRGSRRLIKTIERYSRDLDARLGDVVQTGISQLGLLEPSPQEKLAAEVSVAAGLPRDALTAPDSLGQRRFRLVADVDEPTALALSQHAHRLGFRAQVTRAAPAADFAWWPIAVAAALFVAAMVVLPMVMKSPWPTMFFGFFLIGWPIKSIFGGPSLPLAYGRDLRPMLDPRHAALAARLDPETAVLTGPTGTVAERIVARVAAIRGRLDALPATARRDLAETLDRIEARAGVLGGEVSRLGAVVAQRDEAKGMATAARIEARIERLQTLHASGQPVDAAEVIKLEAALTGHRAALAADADDEAHLSRLQGELLSLSAAVARADRSLTGAPDSADAAKELLAHVTRVEAVREEMGRKPEDPLDRARRAAAARREQAR